MLFRSVAIAIVIGGTVGYVAANRATVERSVLGLASTSGDLARNGWTEGSRVVSHVMGQVYDDGTGPVVIRMGEGVPRAVTKPARKQVAASNCHPSYQGACLRIGVDYDCAGGNGRPPFTGRVSVVGPDVYRLDSDDDGIGCE